MKALIGGDSERRFCGGEELRLLVVGFGTGGDSIETA